MARFAYLKFHTVAPAVLGGFLLFAACTTQPRRGERVARLDSVLLMSDVHFDPLADAELVPELVRTEASQWKSVLARGGKLPSAPHADANFALIESALDEMAAVDPTPPLIVISGDFLPHKFEEHFDKIMPGQPHPVFAGFADKTMEFVAQEIASRFPGSVIVPVLGNNDSDCADYAVTPGGAFLKTFAKSWRAAVDRRGGAGNFVADVSASGHFTVLVDTGEGRKLRLIAINDNYWSRRYENRCESGSGNPAQKPGAEEMTWLKKQLEKSRSAGEPVWLVDHIPAGIDVMTTVFKEPHACENKKFTSFLNPEDNVEFLGLIHEYSSIVQLNICGHTHNNDFRLYDVTSGSSPWSIPSLIVPSIGPNHGNNPAFEILSVDPRTLELKDLAVYALDLYNGPLRDSKWKRLYDFDRDFHQPRVSASSLHDLERVLEFDPRMKEVFGRYSQSGAPTPELMLRNWRAYTCGIDHLDAASFDACFCK